MIITAPILSTIAVICNVALTAGVAYYAWRGKRWLWAESEGLRRQQIELQRQLVTARKEIILSSVGPLRLPPLMPSQNGEDVLIHRFFDGSRTGFFVEIGAYDGVGFSNTYFLEAMGWDGVLVEAVPEHADACRRQRPHSRVVQAACGNGSGRVRFKVATGGNGVGTLSYMGENIAHGRRIVAEGGSVQEVDVPLMSLLTVLGESRPVIDLMSIDVEGAELEVLGSANIADIGPTLIVVEDQTGGADSGVETLLASAGYRKDLVWTHNVFYVKASDPRRVGF